MNITTFLHTIAHEKDKLSAPVICFQGHEYPVIFFAFLCEYLSNISRLSLATISTDELKCSLETSFLGQECIYFLGDISSLEKRKKQDLIHYLTHYHGPHTVLFYCADDVTCKPKHGIVIALEKQVSMEVCQQLISLFPESWHRRADTVIKKLAHKRVQLSLDQMMLVLHYGHVLGNGFDDFLHDWFPNIFVQESSLFTLSQHFFGRNTMLFYPLWRQVADAYPETFWVTFWAEQLWRAHFYLKLRSTSYADAKKVSYRLPFSFTQRDWHNVTTKELQHAHQFLYETDVAVKNSLGQGRLELFFATFFERQFKNSKLEFKF